ncbi:L,D-transpeptidase [Streptomyces sp. MAR4 CNX-425]|uniref:L,D-transpeptidase n=1 Tax=Streptomyces sp. MAR4 CNX-425 TaxID=3406343 RepID=UPI003B510584
MRWTTLCSAAVSAATLSVLLAAPTAATGAATAPRDEAPCTAGTAPYQRQLEAELNLEVDGRQSPEDCRAIRDLQRRLGVRPADGRADLRTYRFMLADRVRRDPAERRECPTRAYRVTCVDLNRQLLWVQKGERLVFDPVPVRTGRDGLETRGGWHRIYWRNIDHFSTIYNVPMPYAQFFDGGQALHGTDDDLFTSGSGGCVNLTKADAKQLWDLLRKDDHVYVWGTKPGTAG